MKEKERDGGEDDRMHVFQLLGQLEHAYASEKAHVVWLLG